MKVILVLVCLSPHGAHAESELGLGLKGGPNAATLAEDHRVNRYGVSAGIAGFLRRPLDERFSLAGQLEVLYTARGAETIFEGEYLGRTRLHYTDIMVAARPAARLGSVSVYLLLGGGVDLLLRADKENASGTRVNATGDFHRVDVSLLAGAGVAMHLPDRMLGPLRLGAVLLEGRHDRGLLDTDAVNGGFKNRSTSIMLGVSFALGGAAGAHSTSPPTPGNPPAFATAAAAFE